MEQGTELGRQARFFLDRGKYVTDEMALQLATRWLSKISGSWVLDGFPRTLSQAKALDDFLGGEEAGELQAISLEGSVEVFSRRSLTRRECSECPWQGTKEDEENGACPTCGNASVPRHDDDEESFLARWSSFEELTKPVLGYYVQSQRLLTVSGEQAPDEVLDRIRRQLTEE